MEVYLDNSATTRVYPETAELMMKILTEDFGNPSSMHKCGVTAEHYVRDAQADAAKSIHALPEEILFTSGGTESNNEALMGTALARKRTGMHILSTNVEHPSVGAALDFLEKEGFLVTRLPVNADGIVTPEQVTEALRPDTILVSVMMVNNEIGSIFPIEGIAKAVHKKNPKTYVHTDAIQAYGKLPINVSKLNVDLLSVSAHKLHGPKGVGFLYVRKGLLLRPIIYGGGQQKGMRSGTENVPGIAGFASAIRRSVLDQKVLEQRNERIAGLRDRLIAGLTALPEVFSHSFGAPHIASISFTGVRAEVMLHSLESEGIYVSAGSACSSNKKRESSVLKAIDLPAEQRESTLRFSFSEENTEEEVDYVIETVTRLLPTLRHYTRG
ncbi:MAG: cysteine desulfurase [Eubacterium sp.]|nr:cysteine desulfurase [Eubacterium sp.]